MNLFKALRAYRKQFPERFQTAKTYMTNFDVEHFAIWYDDFMIRNYEHEENTHTDVVKQLFRMEQKK